jgi:hypothetical protein
MKGVFMRKLILIAALSVFASQAIPAVRVA